MYCRATKIAKQGETRVVGVNFSKKPIIFFKVDKFVFLNAHGALRLAAFSRDFSSIFLLSVLSKVHT